MDGETESRSKLLWVGLYAIINLVKSEVRETKKGQIRLYVVILISAYDSL